MFKEPSKISRIIFAGIIILLVFAPLAFGSMLSWWFGGGVSTLKEDLFL